MINKPDPLNRLAARQLRKAFPDDEFTEQGLELFIKLVNDSYNNMDDERALNVRAMNISQKELEAINNELNQRNVFLDSFNHGLAHDVKNHTANILGLIQMLRKYLSRNNTDMVEKIIDRLDQSTNQLTSIVQGFLYLSKFENKTDDEFTEILPDVLQAAVQLEIQYLLLGKNVSLHYDFRCEELVYSKHILQIIFVNLISNSIKFSKPNVPGVVKASLTKSENELQIVVSDNGVGMNLDDPDNKVFKLFYRSENVSTEKGYGVGLYVIKKIIDRNHGQIHITSKPGEGTTIAITLPLQKPE
ncbi:MAG: HAMP domain-containing histidine kinase [Bacteroidia bacterium]|jgi:signal transduction histidine kinase|nr:HAMP domain-containing histidine kinase [Bacteroidia bacterium]